ncbi:MAG: UDP-3-O-(3-hydroxymyristoyl)glucosamine N-acyltransferase [Candidatus Delongbacteria bacterium]|jgi:UDP-3-O-[3-hydroxymyristoyl] glucosamine N-acyltransferase|nr:UDP-3-O-(3-hydroxymyristoyl)glucosamine N-acyltransferase [Candidatus Delongbacteria bacterium]
MSININQIAEIINAEIVNPKDIEIKNVSKIDKSVEYDVSFLHNQKYFSQIKTTNASAVIVPKDFTTDRDIILLRVDDPYVSFVKIMYEFYPVEPVANPGIDAMTSIDKSVIIGENQSINPFVFIGKQTKIGINAQIQSNVTIGSNVQIGDNVTIYSNVSIREGCIIGNNVILQNAAVIGSDGFGFAPGQGSYEKIPQVGNVILEDNVEIGANTVVDRSTMGSTLIKKGTKLDNLIQVGHNVEIGNNVVIAGQTGIAGSTTIGDNCMISGQVGFVGHLTVGKGVMIGAQAGITGNIKDGSVITGTPSRDLRKMRKIDAALGRLPDLIYKVRDLEKKLKDM